MARRRYPIGTVQIHEAGSRYAITKPAWAAYHTTSDLLGLGAVVSNKATAHELGIPGWPGDAELELASWTIDKTAGSYIHCRPFLDSAMPPTISVLTYLGGADDATYMPLAMPGIWQEGVLMDSADEVVGFGTWETKFQLCRDGWFAFHLWRAKLEPEPDEEFEEEPEIEENDNAISDVITWGGAPFGVNYRIEWSRNGGAKLWCGNVYDDRFSTNIRAETQAEEGEMLSLMIGVLGGYLVAIDLVSGESTYFRPTEANVTWEPTTVRFTHGFGQGWLAVSRVLFHEAIASGRMRTERTLEPDEWFSAYLGGYSVTGDGLAINYHGVAPWPTGDNEPAWSSSRYYAPDGTYVKRPAKDGELAIGARYWASHTVEWKAKLKPLYLDNEIMVDGNQVHVVTYATPVIAAVGISQGSVLTDNGPPAVDIDLTERGVVKSLELDQAADFGATQLTINLTARDSALTARDIPPLRPVYLTDVGWLREGGSSSTLHNVAKLYTMEPKISTHTASIQCMDLMSVLAMAKFDQVLPVFDGCTVAFAIRWLLESLGIGPTMYSIEDLYHPATSERVGRLTWGTWEEPLWQPKRGATYASFIREMLRVCGANAAIWDNNGVLTTGCRYCGAQRSGDRSALANGYWAWHCDAGWSSTGCRQWDKTRSATLDGVDRELYLAPESQHDPDTDGIVVEFSAETRLLDSDCYANYVSVSNEAKGKPTYTAILRNAAHIAQYGVLSHIETSNTLQSQADANQLAVTLMNELNQVPLFCEGTCLLDPAIQRGHVVRIHCARNDVWGFNGHLFRIVSVKHTLKRGQATTTFRGRWIEE